MYYQVGNCHSLRGYTYMQTKISTPYMLIVRYRSNFVVRGGFVTNIKQTTGFVRQLQHAKGCRDDTCTVSLGNIYVELYPSACIRYIKSGLKAQRGHIPHVLTVFKQCPEVVGRPESWNYNLGAPGGGEEGGKAKGDRLQVQLAARSMHIRTKRTQRSSSLS